MKYLLPLLLLLSTPSMAMVVYDPSNFAQNFITAENSASQLINQATQIQNQITSIENQIKNTGKLSQYDYQNMRSLVNKLNQLRQQGAALRGDKFNQTYPGYSETSNQSYESLYQGWSQSTLDTLQSNMDQQQAISDSFDEDQSRIDHLMSQSQSAQGRMEVLQVLVQLNGELINQIQSLKQIIMAQSSGQTAYMAQQASQEANQQKTLDKLSNSLQSDFPTYGTHQSYGFIPTMGGSNG